jgi:hypothetical protein
MGKITIRETSSVGESFSEVEYIFEDSVDYFAWSEQKTEALNNALKGFSDSLLDTQGEVGENVTEIKVGKKKTEPTKH